MKTLRHALLLCTTLLAAMLATTPLLCRAQTSTGTMNGVVVDTDKARIPGAKVVLYSARSGFKHQTVSDGSGAFEFTVVPTGTYSITITMPGFETLVTKDIEIHPNDILNLSGLSMKIGSESVNVTVEATSDISTSGERSSLITAGDIQKLSTVGRDVSELLKTQAGFSLVQSGLDNSAASSAEVAGTYSGLTNYVGNGATGNGASLIADGANVTDPVTGNGQTQTVNMDFVQEVKIETSNFGADTAHGPTVITAVGKSGGQAFHGNLRLYARTYQLNGQDWFQKFVGFGQIKDRYIYPGAEIGGPVIFPHSNFNSQHKLTFEAGGEDYVQRNVYAYGSLPKSLLAELVPTKRMINGDFSEEALAQFLGVTPQDILGTGNYGNGCTPTGRLSQYLHICAQPGFLSGSAFTTLGQLPAGVNGIDPGARALLRAYYGQNCSNTDLSSCGGPGPTFNEGEAYNVQTLNLENPDSYQMRSRIDYRFNDANKVYFVYNGQYGFTSGVPEQLGYSPGTGGSAILGGADTPGKTNVNTKSNTGSANYTHIFNSRMTNELFGALAQNSQSYNSQNRKLLTKNYWGYPYGGLFANGTDELPEISTYSTTGSQILPFEISPDYTFGPFIARRFLPSGGDNFTWVLKGHTLKFGVYLEKDTANQTDQAPVTNGSIQNYYVPQTTGCGGETGIAGGTTQTFANCGENYLADFFLGDIGSYTQQNKFASTDLDFWTISWFATDSYKLTRRLTLDYGLRFDHLGPWQDKHGLGMATFYPSLYATDPAPYQQPDGTAFLPGVRWHGGNHAMNLNAGDAAVPLAGVKARWAFISPRVGVAFDVYGDGKTIFRGGWGMYRSHDSLNDFTGPQETSQGVVVVSAGGSGSSPTKLSQFAGTSPTIAGLACNTNTATLCPAILAVNPTDNQQPLTETYSFSVSQRMPGNSVFDIAYVGNQSSNLLTQQQNNISDINYIPIGSFFNPDPNKNSVFYGQSYFGSSNSSFTTGTQISNDYRPYPYYSHIGIPRHFAYSNYNGLQTSFNRQRGRLNYGLNYTWSKALGIRGAFNNGGAEDPSNLRADYGPLSFDRTSLVAASYSYDEGKRFGFKNHLLTGLANNWFISGITNFQSGPNLQAVYSPNLMMSGYATSSYGGNVCSTNSMAGQAQACNITNINILGTPDVTLMPILRPGTGCPSGNPTVNLAKHQYINGNCFGLPPYGINGPTNAGYLRGPAFFNSDLTLQKTIPLKGERNIQLRAAGFNFLNHPLPSFSSRFPKEANLQFYDPNYAGFAGVVLANGTNPTGSCSVAGSQCFGYAGYKTGRRVLEVSMRYNF